MKGFDGINLIGARVVDVPVPIPNSVTTRCVRCDLEVWIGPDLAPCLDVIRPMCTVCVGRLVTPQEDR